MTLVMKDERHTVHKEGQWLYLNEAAYGVPFTDTDGVRRIIVWKRRIETYGKRAGFYIPAILIRLHHLFEVKTDKGLFFHYLYNADLKQAVIHTEPLVFVNVSRMTWIDNAPHFVRPKRSQHD